MNLNSLIQKFLLQEIQEQIKLFPPALDYIYAHVVDSLRQKYPGLDSSNFSLNDP